jgi:hypothetical protein
MNKLGLKTQTIRSVLRKRKVEEANKKIKIKQ